MKNLLIATLMVLSGTAFSQENYTTSIVDIDKEMVNNLVDWTTYLDSEDFTIEYKLSNCDPEMGYDYQEVQLRFVNKTANHVSLSWYIDLYYDGECKTCDYPVEYSRLLELPASQVIEGDCERDTDRALKLFSRFNDQNYSKGAKLTGFQLNSLTVKVAQ